MFFIKKQKVLNISTGATTKGDSFHFSGMSLSQLDLFASYLALVSHTTTECSTESEAEATEKDGI